MIRKTNYSVKVNVLKVGLFIIGLLFCEFAVKAQNNKNFLTEKTNIQKVSEVLLNTDQWASIIEKKINWNDAPIAFRENIISEAESYLGTPIPSLSATLTLEYSINGNRTNYQTPWFERRNRLTNAVLAECMERKGRFLDDIVDGVWAICEESWWGFPAHHYQYGQVGLPDIEDEYVDLFAAETGVLLTWTHFLLQKELDSISPVINKRISLEIDRRILKPNLEHEDFHWMGYNGENLNNWTPWICSNWLTCILFLEKNDKKRAASVYKIMTLLDRFLKPYPVDGACDEGPAYWNRAGGSLFDCLDLLEEATNGEVAIWNETLIKNIGKYIYKAHIKEDYYVNFADATAKVKPDAALIYEYGNKINDVTLVQFAAWLAKKNADIASDNKKLDGNNRVLNGNIARQIRMIQTHKKLREETPREPVVSESWFANSQIMMMREDPHNGKGFYIAAKGGHNRESHNHNDVGSFIVYYDGKPVLIDLGLETYTKKSFSSQRYEIWITQSQYHNLPTINGEMQSAGRSFKATNVNYNPLKSTYTLDMASAYPKTACVNKWERTIYLDKEVKSVNITDVYKLSKLIKPNVLNFMTDTKPEKGKGNTLHLFASGNDKKKIIMSYPETFNVNIEPLEVADPLLKNSWGDKVYRIQLIQKKMYKASAINISLISE
ncbi:heparinase II/III family protein [Flavivirga amylovorans]|uniref:Heparinase II/III family protein n=1 Tax=Flavivirga amylovorans TaxID=870486 RepID=A0ABT8WY08_9FLAO|nr:heparinase II/III family protein [Flavivirga amylovorans]MDO5986576.1 heparinase II/III family protein [Flavivirga amylovorans]